MTILFVLNRVNINDSVLFGKTNDRTSNVRIREPIIVCHGEMMEHKENFH